ncbi:hypothetical protein L1987_70682 [Smallanthus sonchifolius]|uniref:Uncharacterized protein n=1 Tax=Smallanthus sonchifolius TaxID=185202 RepID=A0ACB9AQZ6_9ASTR|nr:hypothetical protein L1987_70682 [Smallanthus sonchifolius]
MKKVVGKIWTMAINPSNTMEWGSGSSRGSWIRILDDKHLGYMMRILFTRCNGGSRNFESMEYRWDGLVLPSFSGEPGRLHGGKILLAPYLGGIWVLGWGTLLLRSDNLIWGWGEFGWEGLGRQCYYREGGHMGGTIHTSCTSLKRVERSYSTNGMLSSCDWFGSGCLIFLWDGNCLTNIFAWDRIAFSESGEFNDGRDGLDPLCLSWEAYRHKARGTLQLHMAYTGYMESSMSGTKALIIRLQQMGGKPRSLIVDTRELKIVETIKDFVMD